MVDQPNNEGQNGFISTFNIDGAKFVIPDTVASCIMAVYIASRTYKYIF